MSGEVREDQFKALVYAAVVNSNPIRRADPLRLLLISPPHDIENRLQAFVNRHHFNFLIGVGSSFETIRIVTKEDASIEVSLDAFLAECARRDGLQAFASWRNFISDAVTPAEVAAARGLRDGGIWIIYTAVPIPLWVAATEQAAALVPPPPDMVVLSRTFNRVTLQVGATPWEISAISDHKHAVRVPNLPLENTRNEGVDQYEEIYRARAQYSQIEPYNAPTAEGDLPHFEECQAVMRIGISRLDSVTYHPPSGCVFTASGDVVHDTTWHVLFHENEVPGYYASQATNWRLWRSEAPSIEGRYEGEYFLVGGKLSSNYFHWFNEIVPRLWLYELCRNYGLIDQDLPIILPSVPGDGFQEQFLRTLPIAFDRYHFIDNGFHEIERAVLPKMRTDENRPFSPSFLGFKLAATPEAFFEWLIDNTRCLVDLSIAGASCIFLSRSDTTKRVLVNEPEVITFLERKGFTIVRTGGLSLSQQVSLMRRASLVVGPHGAGLTNFAFARLDATLVEIRNPENRDNGMRFMAQYRGSQYICFSSEQVVVDGQDPKEYDMRVDMKVFARFYKEVLGPIVERRLGGGERH